MSDVTTPAAPESATLPAADPQAPAPQAEQRDADKPLGEGGLKALQAERERGDRLERELKAFAPVKEQMDALRSVFGEKAQGVTPADDMKNLQTQVEQLLRENAVNALARTHGITDDADIARLARIPDPELRADLAERLKPSPAAPAAPQTDPGQGARSSTQSAEDAAYAQFYPSR